MSQGKSNSSFEKDIKILDDLILSLENGEVNLETLVHHYHKGLSIISSCREKLKKAELEIEKANSLSDSSESP